MQQKIFITMFLLFAITPMISCSNIIGSQELASGKEYYKHSNYELAVIKYSQAIKKNPNHWKFYIYRAEAYQKINKIDLAIIDLSCALERIPKIDRWYSKLPIDELALVYIKRGTLYHENNFYELAINDYNKAIEIDPNCTGAYFYRAASKEKMYLLSEAIEDYSETVNMMSKILSGISDLEKLNVYLKRANVYRKLNKFDRALEDNNRALKIEGTWDAFFSRGVTLLKNGNFEKAISDFDTSIKLNPSDENAFIYRASARLITNCDLKKVLEDYYAVIEIKNIENDTRQLVYNQIAWILATAHDDSVRDGYKALVFARKSVEIEATCRNLDTLAITFAGNGHFEEAINIHKQAIELCKIDNPELLSEVEKHLENYKLKKALRVKCPGVEIEKEQLHKWQSE